MIDRDWEGRPAAVFGVCWWNRKSAKGLLGGNRVQPVFSNSFEVSLDYAKRNDGCVVGWASRISSRDEAACLAAGTPLVRVEDGFLRSVGLGAGLAPAASLVLDSRGIYYDSTRPSDIEWMLEHVELDEQQRERGAKLRQKIVASRLSKYNLGDRLGIDEFPADKCKVLVPGQVADDAAIIKTQSDTIDLVNVKNINIELLKAARKNNPDAFIIYKPHPDVASGLRKGRVRDDEALCFADRVITNVDIIELIELCDRVETLSSLSGFEALLRGKSVTVHGLPFYAGWGLTTDMTLPPRRTRMRNIDELTYIALVAYSHTLDPVTFQLVEPEELIETLSTLRQSRFLKLKNALRLWVALIGDKLNPYS